MAESNGTDAAKKAAEELKAKEGAEAKAKAEAEAKAKTDEETDEKKSAATGKKSKKNDWNPDELVEITLFKDNNKYKDDVVVIVNGENCVIQRGEKVKIKRKFYDALMDSEKQRAEGEKLIGSMQNE